jgi:uncharacterized repeat protein (TIGR03843 family)
MNVLSRGHIEVKGRIPWSSNATFLTEVQPGPGTAGGGAAGNADGPPMLAIYKPAKGERPLWDFPRGLWKREVAAYELATHLGWEMVPPTVARDDGPLGPGSLQLWVDALFDEHYFTLLDSPQHHLALRRIGAFDLVVNNADRKAGHCLVDSQGHVWAIDHGLSFHSEPKLRTVIWDFVGNKIDDELLDNLAPLSGGDIPSALVDLLDEEELAALVARAARVRARRKYPAPTNELP